MSEEPYCVRKMRLVDWYTFRTYTHTCKFVARKTEAALKGGLGVILCIGETLQVRLATIDMMIA